MQTTWKLGPVILVLILVGCGKDKTTESSGAAGSVDKAGPAAPTYTVKLKLYPDIGKTMRVSSLDRQKGTTKVTSTFAPGKETARDEETERVCTMTVTEAGSPRPMKYKETYDKATTKTDGSVKPRPLQGKTIVYDNIGEKYKLVVEGAGGLPKQDLDSLKLQANRGSIDETLAPSSAVKVGDTWTVDPEKAGLTLVSGAEVDAGKSKVDAKLVKVYDKEGKPYATIEYNVRIAYKRMQGLLFNPPLILEGKGTLDTVRDGSSTYRKSVVNVKFAGKGHPDQKGASGVTVELDQTFSSDEEHSAEK